MCEQLYSSPVWVGPDADAYPVNSLDSDADADPDAEADPVNSVDPDADVDANPVNSLDPTNSLDSDADADPEADPDPDPSQSMMQGASWTSEQSLTPV